MTNKTDQLIKTRNMKNRLLPFGLVALLLGCACLFFSPSLRAVNPENSRSSPGSDLRMHQIRSNQVTGMVSPADVLKARNQARALQTKSTAGLGLDWMHIGPSNWAGRSRVVLFDNQDPESQTLFTGGVTGGIWKSTNLGLTWHAVNEGTNEVLRVSAMTQTPGGTIYVGTGEYYCDGGDFMGTGLYRSDDGLNFSPVPGTQPVFNDPQSNWAYVTKLACDPASGRLFAATTSGLNYSDDGNTWHTLMTGLAADVAVGSDGTVVFVVDGSVYIAAGGNLTNLVDVSTGETGMLPDQNVGWISVAVAPTDPSVIYASIARAGDYYLLNVYRSENKGNSWNVIFPANTTYEPFNGSGCYANSLTVFPQDPNSVLLGGANCWLGMKYDETGYFDWQEISFANFASSGSFAFLFHHCYMFRPNHPEQFAIATDMGIAIGTLENGTWNFQTSNRNLMTSQFISVELAPIGTWAMGGGVLVGTQLFNAVPANDPLEGYVPTSVLQTGLINGTYCQWSQLKPHYIMYSGTNFGTNEPYIRSEDLGETAALSFLGTISSTVTRYLTSAFWETDNFPWSVDTLWLYARQAPIEAGTVVSMESMNCFECLFDYTVPVDIPIGDSLPVLDPFHSRFFLFGTSLGRPGIYMTQDAIKFYKVPSWAQIGVIETNDIVTCLALSGDLNVLWAGTQNGKIYRFSNLTRATDSLSANVLSPYCIVSRSIFEYPEMDERHITSVVVDPNNNEHVLVTLGNYGNTNFVYLSQNALDSLPGFISVQGDLPHMPVYDGIIEMHDGNKVILGTDMGIFSTSNIFSASPTWSQEYQGMGDVPVTDIHQQTWDNFRIQNLGYIAAASYGQGLFWDTTYFTPLGIKPVSGQGSGYTLLHIRPNPVRETATVTYSLPGSEQVNAWIYDLTGRCIKSFSLGKQSKGIHTSEVDLSSLPDGTYIIKVHEAFGKVVKTQ
jgi:hypothetical protein